MAEERIQKLIAASGLCSRRAAEELIREGRVSLNGREAVLGDKADPANDHIKVDGKHIKPPQTLRYLLLYKPVGVVTTCEDPEERNTVLDLIPAQIKERLVPVGRLDYNSEGLLLMTNDGTLANRVAHPRHGLVREYEVKVKGDPDDRFIARVAAGAVLEGKRVVPLSFERIGTARGGANTWFRIKLGEGRTHEVRELCFRAGHSVQRLRRSAIGPVRDDTMGPGDLRELTERELAQLRKATDKTAGKKGRGSKRRQSSRSSSSSPSSRASSSKRGGKPKRSNSGS